MSTNAKRRPAPDDDYRLEEQIGFLLRRAHQFATDVFNGQVGTEGVTPTQFSTLIKLLECGEMSQTALGEATAMDPATILGVVQRLAVRALLIVRADPTDGRRRLIRLTQAGQALATQLRAVGPRISERTLAGFSGRDRKTLSRLLARLGARKANRNGGPQS